MSESQTNRRACYMAIKNATGGKFTYATVAQGALDTLVEALCVMGNTPEDAGQIAEKTLAELSDVVRKRYGEPGFVRLRAIAFGQHGGKLLPS